MGAGATGVTKVLDQIATEAALVTGFTAAGRVFQGKKVHDESDNHEENIRGQTAEAQGYFTFSLESRQAGTLSQPGAMIVKGLVEVYLPQEDSTDANSAYDLVENLFAALMKSGPFDDHGAKPSGSSAWGPVEDLGEPKDGIAEFEMSLVSIWDLTVRRCNYGQSM